MKTCNAPNIKKCRIMRKINGSWYDWSSSTGVGTGIQDGQGSELNVGGRTGTSSLDGYMPAFGIGPYNAIWPLEGWNNGRPPKHGKKPY